MGGMRATRMSSLPVGAHSSFAGYGVRSARPVPGPRRAEVMGRDQPVSLPPTVVSSWPRSHIALPAASSQLAPSLK
eukprot:scaffold80913_cov102-Phaeocystis_antarctica.AAC.1